MDGPDEDGTLSEAAPQQLHGDAIAAQDVLEYLPCQRDPRHEESQYRDHQGDEIQGCGRITHDQPPNNCRSGR